jgi:hypothetical protein
LWTPLWDRLSPNSRPRAIIRTPRFLASKHRHAPIDPLLWNEVDPDVLQNATDAPVAFLTVSKPLAD